VANVPARGISDAAMGALSRQAMDQGKTCWDLISTAGNLPGVTAAAAEAMQTFARTVERYRVQLKTATASLVARDFIDAVDYHSALRKAYSDPLDHQARWNSVREVVSGLADFEQQKNRRPKNVLGDFLNDLALRGKDFDNDKESKLKQNAVGLLTLHAAKGLEFPVVYLVGMEEGLLPHYRSVESGAKGIDEERRLCYVGVTRAEEHLTLTFAKLRRRRGKPRPSKPSRFLGEMVGKRVDVPDSRPSPKSRGQRRVRQ
jgi:DNA helicase-2/ATP-dependent DNA helicase PcrA